MSQVGKVVAHHLMLLRMPPFVSFVRCVLCIADVIDTLYAVKKKKEDSCESTLSSAKQLRSPRGDICGLSSITWWVTDVAFFSFLSRWGQNPSPTRPLTSDPRIARGGRCQKTKKVLRLHISFAVAKTFFWICADDGEKSCYKVLRPECACHHFVVGSLSL